MLCAFTSPLLQHQQHSQQLTDAISDPYLPKNVFYWQIYFFADSYSVCKVTNGIVLPSNRGKSEHIILLLVHCESIRTASLQLGINAIHFPDIFSNAGFEDGGGELNDVCSCFLAIFNSGLCTHQIQIQIQRTFKGCRVQRLVCF